jgi:hypothetical protein
VVDREAAALCHRDVRVLRPRVSATPYVHLSALHSRVSCRMIPQGLGGAGGAMRKNLVIVAAGDRSLHRAWLAADRSFDLWVIYYGDNPETLETYRAAADRCFSAKGLKIALARSLLI